MVLLRVYRRSCGFIPKVKVWESPVSSVVKFLGHSYVLQDLVILRCGFQYLIIFVCTLKVVRRE